jgi:hypothetical protein
MAFSATDITLLFLIIFTSDAIFGRMIASFSIWTKQLVMLSFLESRGDV